MKRYFSVFFAVFLFNACSCSEGDKYYPGDGEEGEELEDVIDVIDVIDIREEDVIEEDTPTLCGNGIIEEGEECDDGDDNSDTEADACRRDCRLAHCGDGVTDTGEGCDDGNDVDTDECRNNCSLPTCGNGEVEFGEECDDANDDNTDDCLDTCRNAVCGDGYVRAGFEECDDRNHTEGDGCDGDCMYSCHGDGECDDSNVCTDDSCEEGGSGMLCTNENNEGPCDDGDPCTDPDECNGGECVPGEFICECRENSDCLPFEDGDLCNGTYFCDDDHFCKVDPATVIVCDSSSDTDCRKNLCDPPTGNCNMTDMPAGAECNDGNPCNADDRCDGAGTCIGDPLVPIVDGGFETAAAWRTTGTALVDTTAPGHDEAGEGRLPDTAVCALDEISQTVTMPSIDDCGPARLIFWVGSLTPFAPGSFLAANMSGNWIVFEDMVMNEWLNVSNCLGEAAYGGSFEVTFASAFPPSTCGSPMPPTQGLTIDNVSIVFDPLCPHVGEVANGDLEAGDGRGWSLSTTGSATAEADAAGAGVGGSCGARISCSEGCTEASMSVPMSVPMPATMAHPALSFQASLSAGEPALFTIRNVQQRNMVGTGAFGEVRVCLPHHLAGDVYDLDYNVGCWGTCGAPMGPRTLVVDDFSVIDDSSCLFASGMLDPGFEMSAADSRRYGWVLDVNETSFGGNPVSEIVNNALQAHSGSASLHMSLDQHCDIATAGQAIEIPGPSGVGGPALVFWYRYPSPLFTDIHIIVSTSPQGWGEVARQELSGSNTYVREVLCLPPAMAGRPASLEVWFSSPGTCATFFPSAEEAWFDDFAVTTDPSCPAS